MELVVKHFRELSAEELFDIYKLRVSVFVVEQACPYQEVDDADKLAYHVFLKDADGIQAYLRVLPEKDVFDEVSIGRVKIEAQTYAKGLYEKAGFVQSSEEFLEDGIPHVQMIWNNNAH